MAREARKTVERHFDHRKQAAAMEKAYRRVFREHRRKRPEFSVIIPTYNRAKYLKKAIKSVLKQTYRNFEVIVVDDGSKDKTKKVAKRFGGQIRYIRQKHRGPSAARNTGIKHARGRYIAFLDSDDKFLPRKLEKNRQFLLKHPKCKFLYSWYYDVNRKGKRVKLVKTPRCKSKKEIQKKLYKRKFTIRTSTVVVKRQCFDEVGYFNPKYLRSQDWDMWLRLVAKYRAYCQRIPLTEYRRHKRRISRGKKSRYHAAIRKNARRLFGWTKKKRRRKRRGRKEGGRWWRRVRKKGGSRWYRWKWRKRRKKRW